jgi:hypothetical protein
VDTRYHDQGYSATFSEGEHGAFLDIRRKGKIIANIGVGFFEGGKDAKAQIAIKRFAKGELEKVIQVNEFEELD